MNPTLKAPGINRVETIIRSTCFQVLLSISTCTGYLQVNIDGSNPMQRTDAHGGGCRLTL